MAITWFDIPSGGMSPGGQIEFDTLSVTKNGTYSGQGKAYTSVTVDVEGGGGSSDFSTAEVTIVNNYRYGAEIEVAIADSENSSTDFSTTVGTNSTATINVILYKGTAYAEVNAGQDFDYNIETEGDIDLDGTEAFITGDCTITIS